MFSPDRPTDRRPTTDDRRPTDRPHPFYSWKNPVSTEDEALKMDKNGTFSKMPRFLKCLQSKRLYPASKLGFLLWKCPHVVRTRLGPNLHTPKYYGWGSKSSWQLDDVDVNQYSCFKKWGFGWKWSPRVSSPALSNLQWAQIFWMGLIMVLAIWWCGCKSIYYCSKNGILVLKCSPRGTNPSRWYLQTLRVQSIKKKSNYFL